MTPSQSLASLVDRLTAEYADLLPPGIVHRCVEVAAGRHPDSDDPGLVRDVEAAARVDLACLAEAAVHGADLRAG